MKMFRVKMYLIDSWEEVPSHKLETTSVMSGAELFESIHTICKQHAELALQQGFDTIAVKATEVDSDFPEPDFYIESPIRYPLNEGD